MEVIEKNGVLYYYSSEDFMLKVKGISDKCKGEIVIPSYLEEFDAVVRSIGERAFSNCTGLSSITIPDSVEIIEQEAFLGCTGLTTITIPDSVETIGQEAFWGCSSLTSITIPYSVKRVGYGAFSGCSGLTVIDVEKENPIYDSREACNAIIETATNELLVGCKNTIIPNTVRTIGGDAFLGCTGLTTITIPDSVETIGQEAFWGCTGLTSITIPDGVTLIGGSVFEGCESLTSVTIPDSVTRIGKFAFSGCDSIELVQVVVNDYTSFYSNKVIKLINELITKKTIRLIDPEGKEIKEYVIPKGVTTVGISAFTNCTGLTSIIIPDSVTSIGDSAFSGCSGLTSIIIPDSVTSIGDSAFSGCSGLTSIIIPDSVTSIGSSAFSGCSSFERIIVGKGNSNYDSRGDCNAIIETATNKLLAGCKNTIIPVTVQDIAGDAFSACSGLTSITIPDSVTSIGNSAFSECSDLTAITIPDSVTSIGGRAFSACSGLTSITIPDSVTNIGNSAFSGCSSLTSITIPESVTSIGDSVFLGCSSLTSITIPESVTSIGGSAFSGCTGLTSITIPDSITSIGSSAFSGCTGLTSITIPDGVTSIGSSAFSGCSGLTSITIPDGVTSIWDSAFSGCSGLTFITIPDSVTNIGNSAFSGCSSLTSITIPEGVTSIGNSAFSGCSGLTSITIPNSVTSIGLSSIFVDWAPKYDFQEYCNTDSVTSIGDSAFSGCSSLSSIFVDKGNPKYDSREDCNAIIETLTNKLIVGCKNTIIPTTVWAIEKCAFSGCTDLTSITIPDSVTCVGDSVFSNCSNLTSIKISDSVMSIGAGAFEGANSLEEVQVVVTDYTKFCSNKVLELLESQINKPISLIDSEGKEINEYVIPEGVVFVANNAFVNCTGLTSITIPDSVKTIGSGAFAGCNSLRSLIIPSGVTAIGEKAFENCNSLSSITIPKDVKTIGSHAFYGCNALTNVYCYSKQVLQSKDVLFENTFCKHATLHVPFSAFSVSPLANPWQMFHRIVSMEIRPEGNRRNYDSKSIIDGVELNYDYIDEFHQGIAIVIKNSLYGAILKGGREIITPSYDYISIFKEGYADAIRDGKCIVLDLSGKEWVRNENGTLIEGPTREETVSETKEVQTPQDENKINIEDYDKVQVLENGLIIVSKDNLYGCVNQVGLIVVPLMYKSLSCQNNLLIASVFDETNSVTKLGVINFANEEVIPLDSKYYEFKICEKWILYREENTQWGAFTLTGHKICDPKYDQFGYYTDYFISVGLGDGTYTDRGKVIVWGLINYSGEEILPFKYQSIDLNKSNGLIIIKINNKKGVIDIFGNILIKPRYNSIYSFQDGFAIVSKAIWINGMRGYMYVYGVINSSLEEIIHCVFKQISYSEKYGCFKTEFGLITKEGEFIARSNGNKILIN